MEETKVAIRAVKEAGKVLMEGFDRVHKVEEKGAKEIVTEADLEAEKAILGILKEEFPDYSILSEESGEEMKGSERMWIVDPLDGTTNYSIRNPFFNSTVALAERVEGRWGVVSGVVYAPFLEEVFFAEKGEGCFLNGEKIRISGEDLGKMLLAYCHGKAPEDVRRAMKIMAELKPLCRDISRMRSGALELAFVACGRIGGFLSPGGRPWDSAAGSLLVKEAGGRVSDFSGGEWDAGPGSRDILATNGVVHEKIMGILKNI